MGAKSAHSTASKATSKKTAASSAAQAPGPIKSQKNSAFPSLDRPTAKQVVGGSSWTGKIPTTLLQEYCQKQGWARCDYVLSKNGQQFSVRHVLLTKKNPRNNEVDDVLLRPSPETLADLPSKSSALEARNVAAIFALHRVASDRSWTMQLPPEYRDIWKALILRKAADEKVNKAWMYASDPFKSSKEHEVRKATWTREAVRKEEQVRKAAFIPPKPSFVWEHAPFVEMSRDFRQRIEVMVRGTQLDLSSKTQLTPAQSLSISDNLVNLGFRRSHAHEALDSCSSQDDALEWLLLHVPEEDLPARFLPQSYSVGISASQHDTDSLRADYAARRLSQAGFPIADARECLATSDNELLAAELLQASLLGFTLSTGSLVDKQIDWDDEVAGVAATFPESVRLDAEAKSCSVVIPGHKDYQLSFRPPVSGTYPDVLPTISIQNKQGKMPAYIKLAVIKQVGQVADSLRGEPMLFSLIDWTQDHLQQILDNPGRLSQISGSINGPPQPATDQRRARKHVSRARSIAWDKNSPVSVSMRASRDALLLDRKHAAKITARQTLPAWAAQDEIINMLKHNSALIISGETGSGKSTQTVQFVLDALISDGFGDAASILCTQPRRISAIGLAERVADERSCAVGSQVGYQIRGESKVSNDTKIVFMTTGVLLRRLATTGDAGLEKVTHVFVDEVHERSVDSDFLLILLKDLLERRQDLKVILMSATLDADFFASYLGAQQMTIQGRTFPVTDYYVEDMTFLAVGSVPRDKTKNGVDYDMIVDLVRHVETQDGSDLSSILIFLPGVLEISRCLQAITASGISKLVCLPLHASLPGTEQRKVFQKTPGRRRIIAATNIAETSITIDDVGYVIDTGRVKQMAFDATINAHKFEEVWCSKAACRQRRGRAGRVKAGICYKTFSRALETAKMLESTPPEILRVPLEQVCLSVLAMGKPVESFLLQAVTPPPLSSLNAALETLRVIGATDDRAGANTLTPLGRHLSLIAADVRCAKLLVLSSIFGCLEEALTIAAALSSKPVFSQSPDAKEARLSFASADGDLIAVLNAFGAWTALHSGSQRRQWCKDNMISDIAMQEVASTRSQLLGCLREAGLPVSKSEHKCDITVLKALIGASLSPNIARIALPGTKYAQHQSGSIAKDHESREIKFFTANGRVFLHPTSVLFGENEYRHASFMAFHQQIETSKKFIKQNTPVSNYSQLLFGHNLKLDSEGRGLIVNDWARLRSFPKIGVLCKLLRVMLDNVLSRRYENPKDSATPLVLELISDLLATNGISN